MIILRKIYTEVSKEKHIRVRNIDNPGNNSELHKKVSHDSGPGWEESSECESYSEERSFGVTTSFAKLGYKAATGKGIKPLNVSKIHTGTQTKAAGNILGGSVQMTPAPISISISRSYSEREPVSEADMKKAEESGVVQRKPNGKWGIIAKQKKLWWRADYETKEDASKVLKYWATNKYGGK